MGTSDEVKRSGREGVEGGGAGGNRAELATLHSLERATLR